MAIYKQIFPTRWPLLDFSFEVWKFHIYAGLFRPSIDSISYEYVMVYVSWGTKTILNFRLYDTERRAEDRLSPYLETQEVTEEKLKAILKIVTDELKKVKKRG